MATLNTAEWFRLYDRGAVAPGKRADLVVFADLHDIQPELVFSGGRLVAQEGDVTGDWPVPQVDQSRVRDTVRVDWGSVDEQSLHIQAAASKARVIGLIEAQIITQHLIEQVKVHDGLAVSDPERDILKMAVIERYTGSGNVGLGFLHGLGLQAGALAASVAHDHHNIVVIGVDDVSMLTAARAVGEMGGGLVAANENRVLASVPLPIAGLMSDRSAEAVRDATDKLLINSAALGSALHDPFEAMGFAALEVIPALRLTDQGLIDVEQFKPVALFPDE
jgi:adenine deaminase